MFNSNRICQKLKITPSLFGKAKKEMQLDKLPNAITVGNLQNIVAKFVALVYYTPKDFLEEILREHKDF